MTFLVAWLPVVLPLVLALAGLAAAVLKHFQHAILAELLEEAILLEHEYEDGKPLGQLLSEAAESQAAKDTLQVVLDRVAARRNVQTQG